MEYCLLLVKYRPPIVMATNPATTRITPIAEISPCWEPFITYTIKTVIKCLPA